MFDVFISTAYVNVCLMSLYYSAQGRSLCGHYKCLHSHLSHQPLKSGKVRPRRTSKANWSPIFLSLLCNITDKKTATHLLRYTCRKVILTMSSSLSTQEGSTLCCSVKCKERADLHVCRFWHRGHNHSDTPLLSLLAASPDSSCIKKKSMLEPNNFLKSSMLLQSTHFLFKKPILNMIINF